MNKFTLRQSGLLLLTAAIWGVAFVAQSAGMEYIGPFTFNAIRNLMGAAVLLPCIVFLRRGRQTAEETKTAVKAETAAENASVQRKNLWLGGICCGIVLFAAGSLQQIGIMYTTVGKAGFITAMYIVLVPVFGLFLHRDTDKKVWAAVFLAAAGLYLLCMKGGDISFQKGDVFLLGCAIAFTVHILVIDYFSTKADGVKMSCIQFLTCALLSGIFAAAEKPAAADILRAWVPLAYAGVLSCGVGYTLQIVGQRGMNPTVASLLLSLESVISVLAGWLILGEVLSARELSGCVMMFAAIILAQLAGRTQDNDNT